jgi:hypothetical protein
MAEFSKKLVALPSARPEISESYSANDEEIARAIARAQENRYVSKSQMAIGAGS